MAPKRVFALNEEQKDLARVIYRTPIVVAHGPAGTGKTATAIHVGMKMLKDKLIDQIVLTRPAVSTEDYGFLPGEIADKFEGPYLAPLIDFMNRFGDNKKERSEVDASSAYEKMKAKGLVTVQPLAFMRGQTFDNSYVIFDEVQNATPAQLKMVLTRIGENSRIVLCGDSDQCDLDRRRYPVSGMDAALQLTNHVKSIEDVMLTKCERSPIIEEILRGWQMVDIYNRQ